MRSTSRDLNHQRVHRSSARWLRRWALVVALLVVTAPAVLPADDVLLRNGSSFEDVVVTRTETHVIVELPAGGRLRLPNEQVLEVVENHSPLQRFREYRDELLQAPGSSGADLLELVRWAHLNGLDQEARALLLVLARAQPDLEGLSPLMASSGYERDDLGAWVLHDDLMRRRGLVPFDGEWVTPEERSQRWQAAEAQRVRASYEQRNDVAQRESPSREPSAAGPSDNEVALESIRLARSVVEGTRSSTVGGHGAVSIVGAVVGGAARGHLQHSEAYQAYRAQIRADIEALAVRQPGSILPLSTFRKQERE